MRKHLTMSLILMFPFENMMAFVGVATGSINARLMAKTRGKIKYKAPIFDSLAFLEYTKRNVIALGLTCRLSYFIVNFHSKLNFN
jgi:hypothetical protein